MPVHKVTIIPRGGSLGSTMFIPTKDTYNYAKRRMLNQLATMMGGRIAEEIALGDVTSGASGDIKQATKLARHMVCDWGMSVLGPIALGDNQDTVFLGREISRTQNYSEETAQRIDSEIRRIVDEQYQRATDVINEHRTALDKLADSLLEFETLDGKHVHEIIDHGEIRSAIVRPEPIKKAETPAPEKAKAASSEPETLVPGVDSAQQPA
jgi:cell division protease FtsH